MDVKGEKKEKKCMKRKRDTMFSVLSSVEEDVAEFFPGDFYAASLFEGIYIYTVHLSSSIHLEIRRLRVTAQAFNDFLTSHARTCTTSLLE